MKLRNKTCLIYQSKYNKLLMVNYPLNDNINMHTQSNMLQVLEKKHNVYRKLNILK